MIKFLSVHYGINLCSRFLQLAFFKGSVKMWKVLRDFLKYATGFFFVEHFDVGVT